MIAFVRDCRCLKESNNYASSFGLNFFIMIHQDFIVLFWNSFYYFSTGYVYQGIKGNYSETDPVKPFNNYGLSKLAGECAVSMYKNSLILRICMTEKPFIHNTIALISYLKYFI